MLHGLTEEVALQIALGEEAAWWPEGMFPMDMRIEVLPWHRAIATSVIALIEQRLVVWDRRIDNWIELGDSDGRWMG